MDKKRPVRTCVGCRTSGEKKDFVRIVKDASGAVIIDTDGKAQGRGAYICRNEECIKTAQKRRALSKHFKTAVEDSFYDAVAEAIRDE